MAWNRETLAWLSGIFDGEGCLSIGKGQSLTVKMSDEDVVRRVLEVAGRGYIYKPKQLPNNKQMFIWIANQAEDVYALCAAMYQFLGVRRRNKIEEFFDRYKSSPPILWRIHGTVTKYNRMKCRCADCRRAWAAKKNIHPRCTVRFLSTDGNPETP